MSSTYIPTADEEKEVLAIVKEITHKVNQKDMLLEIGGSIAKGTWLPGASDLDFFLKFDYLKYKNKSAELSDIAEPILTKIFKNICRVHGSRDYFQLNYKGYSVEIVPVLNIQKPSHAKNITDHSPLHVAWVKKQSLNNKKLLLEIRKAKQFFKAQRIYGAESYICGFSGHVIEILICYYGSFKKLLKAADKWKREKVIDAAAHYANANEAKAAINKSKLSPLIIIDPIEKNRNAAAALNIEKLKQLKKIARNYLRKPSSAYFTEVPITLEQLKLNKHNRKLLYLEVKPEIGKRDVVGAKLLKKFEELRAKLITHDFSILEDGWYWQGKGDAIYWSYLHNKKLSKTKVHWGPQVKSTPQNISAFKNKWKTVKIKNNKYYTIVKRKYTKPEDLIKEAAVY